MKKSDLIYAAGLFDGEGCFCISKQLKPGHKTPSWMSVATISMKHKGAFSVFVGLFGGGVSCQRRNGNEIFNWRRYGKSAVLVAKSLLPYLKVKQAEARLIILLGENLKSNQHKGYGYSLSQKVCKEREDLRVKLRKLNAAT